MIIKTSKGKYYIHAKIWMIVAVALALFGSLVLGALIGGSLTVDIAGNKALDLCFEYGLKFLKASNVTVDEGLIRQAVEQYGLSTGYRVLFNEESPWKVNQNELQIPIPSA